MKFTNKKTKCYTIMSYPEYFVFWNTGEAKWLSVGWYSIGSLILLRKDTLRVYAAWNNPRDVERLFPRCVFDRKIVLVTK